MRAPRLRASLRQGGQVAYEGMKPLPESAGTLTVFL